MSFTDSWNKIVAQKNKNLNSKEEIIQSSWELLFSTVFNYPDSDIDSQRSVKMGVMTKRADIVIKNENTDLFVVELKRHSLHEGQEQLFSYLNQLKIDIGILVCNNLYIYDYDYTSKENAFSFIEIPFEQNNQNGSRFIELFTKENFDSQRIKAFIREEKERKATSENIRKELKVELIAELLKKYFSEKYASEDVDATLSSLEISINLKNEHPITHTPHISGFSSSTNRNSYNTVQKSDQEKLKRDINSVGKETFVKYFEYYNNPEYETSDIRKLFEKYENFSPNSMASKASTGKGIVKRGFAKQALEIIANANNIDNSLREKARNYLEML